MLPAHYWTEMLQLGGLYKLGRSISRCSLVGLESYGACSLQPRHITRSDRNGLKHKTCSPVVS